jgi:AbiV family abortive infection protein
MGEIDRISLENGICCALSHSAYLIEDATIMYLADRIPSSFHLAVMAREELGRANLLWKRSAAMGEADTIEADLVIRELKDHKTKLDAGQSTTYVTLPPEMIAAWTAALEKNDKPALDLIHQKRKQIVAQVRKHDPGRLHSCRLKAQYVQLNQDGTWSKPSETERKEAHALILTVASEISGTLLEAEGDKRICDICARAQQPLPTYAEFEARVMTRILSISAQQVNQGDG